MKETNHKEGEEEGSKDQKQEDKANKEVDYIEIKDLNGRDEQGKARQL